MSLVLLCGSLQPGADGVGDYSRRLAAACQQLGVATALVALHDPALATPETSDQIADGIQLPVLRLPATLPWSQRLALTRKQLQVWNCGQLSLQFVPYAFQPRGLPFALPGVIQALLRPDTGGPHRTLQVMLHEIWLGLPASSSMRSRAIGRLQRQIITAIVQASPGTICHTSTQVFQTALLKAGIRAERLPLFSNLPEPESVACTSRSVEPSRFYTGCVFGRIPPEWDPDPVLQALAAKAQQRQCLPRLLLIGRSHQGHAWFEGLRQRWPQVALIEHGPEASPQRLAELIRSCQVGFATTPWALIEKSGAVAAFLSLDVPVVVSRENWHLRARWQSASHPAEPAEHPNRLKLSSWRQAEGSAAGASYQPPSPQQVAQTLLQSLHA